MHKFVIKSEIKKKKRKNYITALTIVNILQKKKKKETRNLWK